MGHSRRFRPGSRKSALPLKADFIADMPDVGFVPRLCENSNARRASRKSWRNLRVVRTENAADTRLDAMSENCIFYISPMYEFLQPVPIGDITRSPRRARGMRGPTRKIDRRGMRG